jgi:hypothetical protein
VSESADENGERLSRQQAAERLTDLAYALIAGGSLPLNGGRRVALPAIDEVVFTRTTESTGDEVELRLELTWSTAPRF